MNTRTITRSREAHSIVVDDNIGKLQKLIQSLDEQSQDGEHEICIEILNAIEGISSETREKCNKLSKINTLLNIIE